LTQQAGIYSEPVWSLEKDRIVFMKGSKQTYKDGDGPSTFGTQDELRWIAAPGGESQLIEKNKNRATPHFVQGKDRIYLYGSEGLVSIRWDGTDEKELVKITGITTYGTIQDIVNHHSLPESVTEPKKKPSNASVIMMAPQGDLAIAKINNEIYTVTIPYAGGETITINVADVSKAAFPARKLTKVGGEFPSWSRDAKMVYWSIGNAFFSYDLAAAKARDEEIAAIKKAKAAAAKAKKKAGEADKKAEDEQKDEDKEKEDKEAEKAYEAEELRIKVQVPRDMPQGSVLLSNARVITMKGDELFEKGDILIENNRIKQVGRAGSIRVGRNVQRMDLSGKTIVPGFVDTHAHMWPAWAFTKTRSGFMRLTWLTA
jgi:hypothetical protein